MKMKNCKVGQLVTFKREGGILEIVGINSATVNVKHYFVTYMFVRPKLLKLFR
jgi:hypothetical protein